MLALAGSRWPRLEGRWPHIGTDTCFDGARFSKE